MIRKKLFFFGVDSATWDLIKPWAKAGLLPAFNKILNEGSIADLESTIPPLTPVAWPTMMTGASPAMHANYDFYKLDENKEITITLASDINYPFVWELLSRKNISTTVLNIPITFPVRPVNGVQLSCFLTPGFKSDFLYPENLKKEFIKKFPKYIFSPKSKVGRGDVESYRMRLKETKQEVTDVIDVCRWALKKNKSDFFAMNFMAVDHVQHFYWEFMKEEGSEFKNAVLEIYQMVDGYLQEVLEKYAQEYQIMVASDHGAGALEKTLFLNVWLQRKGYLVFKNTFAVLLKRMFAFFGFTPQTVIELASRLRLLRHSGKVDSGKRNRLMNKLILSYADIDWEKTTAYSFGMYGGVFINQKSKVKSQKSKLMTRILLEMKKDFRKELTFIDTSENIYKTHAYPETIPDIQFLMKEGAIVSTNIYAFSGNKLFTKPITHKSGEHRVNGILAFYPKLALPKKAKIAQITPTILNFFGIQKEKYMGAKSLLKTSSVTPKEDLFDIEI